MRGGKRIERNETKDGIITLRDICGRAEIEIRDEGFRRCRADTMREEEWDASPARDFSCLQWQVRQSQFPEMVFEEAQC